MEKSTLPRGKRYFWSAKVVTLTATLFIKSKRNPAKSRTLHYWSIIKYFTRLGSFLYLKFLRVKLVGTKLIQYSEVKVFYIPTKLRYILYLNWSKPQNGRVKRITWKNTPTFHYCYESLTAIIENNLQINKLTISI